ncbi:MAG: methylthioadenosine phosphorylase [Candidatus Dadabacteria bacterium RIFCSPHIGHO2_12_FULL_53_21]|nr:MAG: methylthioadenosine phosphorylase [Candidatus Dadabacteria bacterium RIFCSPHIGHO2_12_FULL_53_21]
MKTVGIIGGSGLYALEGITGVETVSVDTPWGKPSDDPAVGELGDTRLVFLPRHGKGHKLMPSEINYRANIFAMKMLGAEWIISVSAVGSMREEIAPGHIVIPSQFYDHTKSRASTFFGDGIAAHVSMADPVCPSLSRALYEAALSAGATVHKDATYICMEGPQFSSRAESNIYRKWGVDVIGMTNMPEAKLAREAEICYSTLALSTDYDCWHEHHGNVTVDDIIETLMSNVALARKVITKALPGISEARDCACRRSLENAIITSRDSISPEVKERLGILIKRYVQ